jgi:1-acyl-sn-glycerol-3-phosphate acyltransferase
MLIKYLRLLVAFAKAFSILWFKFPRASREQKLAHIQAWSRHVLEVMGIQLNIAPSSTFIWPNKIQLLVANHVSWLDVLVIQALQPCVFVAKSEVRHWPVVGSMAHACGVVFVDRSAASSARKMVDDVGSALHHGYCVAGFPEGTSSEGHDVSLFHANLFEAAIHRDVAVLPLALRYTDARTGSLCLKAAFVGDIGFIESLYQVMGTSHLAVDVQIGKTLSPHGHSRRTLAHLSHRSVLSQLQTLQA